MIVGLMNGRTQKDLYGNVWGKKGRKAERVRHDRATSIKPRKVFFFSRGLNKIQKIKDSIEILDI